MQLRDFPGCCTAKVLTGFGGSRTASVMPDKDYDDETMFEDINAHLEHAHRSRMAMVFAATTTEQKMANRVLPRIGFIKIDESAKDAHADFALIGWVFRLNLADAVRPLKVPANPFKKGAKVGDKALQFGDEEPDLMRVNPIAEIAMPHPEQAQREEVRRIFNEMVHPWVPQVNPAPPRAPRRARPENRVIFEDLAQVAAYGELTEPLVEGQIWEDFIPDGGGWMTVTRSDGFDHLPPEQHFRIRSGRVANNRSWYEIHPNDQGRVDMVAIGRTARLETRLFGRATSGGHIQRRDSWIWIQNPRIGRGTITHFCLA